MNLKSELQLIQRQTEQVRSVRNLIESETCACGRPARPNSGLCYASYREMRECHVRIAKQLLATRNS